MMPATPPSTSPTSPTISADPGVGPVTVAPRADAAEVAAVPVSVLIPTLNEERNLAECLDSVRWSDDVVVLDSLSTDRTCEIATGFGARLVQRRFTNHADHKNWALEHVPFKHPWVLIVDADERATPGLRQEIREAVRREDAVGFYVARRNHFMGRWIRHGGWYPDWQLRLFRLGRARYEQRQVHEHMLVDGPVDFLASDLIHRDGKGLERLFDRINRYSTLEASEALAVIRGDAGTAERGIGASLLGKGPHRRRRLKNLAYRHLPFRPLAKFLWMYLFRLGFLDGRPGLAYSLVHAIYEYQVSLKIAERLRQGVEERP